MRIRQETRRNRRTEAPPTFISKACDTALTLAQSSNGRTISHTRTPIAREVAAGMWEAPRRADHSSCTDRTDEDPHSKDLRLYRANHLSGTFFVTKSLWPKKPVLTPQLRGVVCSAFHFAVEHERILLRAFVVMPDHWHALFALAQDWTIPKFMHAFMSFVGGKTATSLAARGCAWEEGFFATRIRSAKQFCCVADYIALNPVRKGLVSTPEQWEASHLKFPELIANPWTLEFEQDAET